MTPRFLKWDYNTNEVIEYERVGECNGCAQCCKAVISYRAAGNYTKGGAPMGDTLDRKGVWSEYSNDGERRFASLPTITMKDENPCKALVDNKCSIHERKSITELTLCMVWPIIPEHVAPFEKCSYSFIEIGRSPITAKQEPPEETKVNTDFKLELKDITQK